jgi:hypothetical protein
MSNLEKNKLAIDQDGLLVETGKKQISVEDYQELIEVNYEPKNNWLVLQPLPAKELKTNSGLIVSAGKLEFKCAVVAAPKNSEYVRGQVVRIDPLMFGQAGPVVDYIEGKPCLDCPEHFIKGIYTNVDLSDWK